uniref:Reverse transcriptase RNase H-like domain-containing protein n=1 Tax=Amphimedon queenslandica TaxID=400682 RepID=A0A1X7VGM7_AMPQE
MAKRLPSDPDFWLNLLDNLPSDGSDDDFDGYVTDSDDQDDRQVQDAFTGTDAFKDVMSRQGSPLPVSDPTLATVFLKLPTFWLVDPGPWFAQFDAQFHTKHPDPYDRLKEELIKRTTASEQRRLHVFINVEDLGDRTPSQLVRRMQQLLGGKAATFDQSFLRQLFLQCFLPNVRMVLASTKDDVDLESLVSLADIVVEVASPAVNEVQTTELSTEVKKLRSDIATLKKLVTSLSNTRHPRSFRHRAPSLAPPNRLTTFCCSSEEEHHQHLKQIFDRYKEYGVIVNPSKCQIGDLSLQFLGDTVNKDGISPLKSRVSEWSEECLTAFDHAKKALANTTLLFHPKPGAVVSIMTDALDEAVRVVLTYDRELLAIYLAIKHFGYYIEGRAFTVYTDHKPLTYSINTMPKRSLPQRARHLDYISQITSDIRYTKGINNPAADTLSRVELNQVETNPPNIDIEAMAADRYLPHLDSSYFILFTLSLIQEFGHLRNLSPFILCGLRCIKILSVGLKYVLLVSCQKFTDTLSHLSAFQVPDVFLTTSISI